MLKKLLRKSNFRNTALAVAAPMAIAIATPAQAVLVIDDYNTTGLFAVTDNSANASPETFLTGIDASNIVWGTLGGTNKLRTISANLSAGDNVTAEICNVCQAGHHTSSPQSGIGNTAFEYGFSQPLTSINATGNTHVSLEYEADVAGADITFVFEDVLTNTGSVSTGALAGGNTPLTILLALPGGVDYSQLAEARIEIAGVGGLDASIDNFQLTSVPEPAAFALFGLGLLGIGYCRRRKRVT